MTNEPNRPAKGNEQDRETLTGPPRWVKVSAIVAGILILVAVAVMLLSGGQHGPARHGLGMGGTGAVSSQAHNEQIRAGSGQV
ncbi:hypothetical protein [Arthrobacter sp. ISL-28]|uniref:hypothetical protein n=1 Tax=Arthrobacter sp. ISL-28 TaxID=2819108 RepID=UPI001BE8B3CA|nr:hypothetical protein [Arthrobacter sp. ISL-28]MBT2521154.1 hypothetical protein [Arthrobacter sp. ISL-28]